MKIIDQKESEIEIMNEKVAIIIPVYNSARFLKECIESAVTQTYENIEIILIDDGSTDNSLEIIRDYSKKDRRIKFKSIENSGVSVARNTGLKMCESKKVVFLDSDDIILPDLVETLIDENDRYDFVMCGYVVNDMNKNIKNRYVCSKFSGDIKEFCNQIIDFLIPPFLLGPCFKLFDYSIIKKWNVEFPIDISYGEDAEFVLSYLEHVETIKCIDYVGYEYKQYDSGTLSKRFRKNKMDIYRRINDHILQLISENQAEGCLSDINNRYVQNYIEYTKELVTSRLSYDEKKKLFFDKGKSNDILEYENNSNSLSLAQKILLFSLKTEFFFPTYLIFVVKEKFL